MGQQKPAVDDEVVLPPPLLLLQDPASLALSCIGSYSQLVRGVFATRLSPALVYSGGSPRVGSHLSSPKATESAAEALHHFQGKHRELEAHSKKFYDLQQRVGQQAAPPVLAVLVVMPCHHHSGHS